MVHGVKKVKPLALYNPRLRFIHLCEDGDMDTEAMEGVDDNHHAGPFGDALRHDQRANQIGV